ncbi:MAG: UPF0104 family protein [Synechococcaceae cyanobacterium]|nr:UPF0104 family protein [Synechococcaceae cyanobacterium]
MTLGFLMASLLGQGRRMLQLSLDLQGVLWLLLGVGLSLLSLLVNGLAWAVVLRWLGQRPRWLAVVALHVSTNLRKYLPGGVWHLASRVQALRDPAGSLPAPLPAPLATAPALVSVLLDPLLAAVGALALMALGGWQRGLGGLGLLPLLLLQPRLLEPLLLRLERRRARDLNLELEAPVRLGGYPWPPLLAETLFVLLRFSGFACCVAAFDLQLSLEWTAWLAGFVLAWTAGLVVPGAPGGLGVFETVLLLRLGGTLPEASLLAVALSYRMIVTAADGLAAGLVNADARLAATGAAPAASGSDS